MMNAMVRSWVLATTLFAVSGAAFAQTRDIAIPISSTSFATAALRVAKELGIFEKHGLNARFITMDSANSATSALISGSAEVVLSGPGELVAARGRGQPIVIVADTYRGLSASLVLGRDVAAKTGVS
jgi:ABC-type nitrate/sulfonate/bicarbonate transport system substrate-binding protein